MSSPAVTVLGIGPVRLGDNSGNYKPRAMKSALLPAAPAQAAATQYDLTKLLELGGGNFLESIQTMYVDNGGNGNALEINFPNSGQNITFPANSQGYINVLCPNPPRFSVLNPAANAFAVSISIINVQLPSFIWASSAP